MRNAKWLVVLSVAFSAFMGIASDQHAHEAPTKETVAAEKASEKPAPKKEKPAVVKKENKKKKKSNK